MKLCGCGDCAQATERAMGLVFKMMADDECPVFVAGVVAAMSSIVQVTMTIDSDGNANLLEALETVAMCDKVNKHLTNVSHELNKDILSRTRAIAAAKRNEQDLPKGD